MRILKILSLCETLYSHVTVCYVSCKRNEFIHTFSFIFKQMDKGVA